MVIMGMMIWSSISTMPRRSFATTRYKEPTQNMLGGAVLCTNRWAGHLVQSTVPPNIFWVDALYRVIINERRGGGPQDFRTERARTLQIRPLRVDRSEAPKKQKPNKLLWSFSALDNNNIWNYQFAVKLLWNLSTLFQTGKLVTTRHPYQNKKYE